MRKQLIAISSVVLASSLIIGGCTTTGQVRPRDVGTVVGGVGGGVLGAAVTRGSAAGAIVGTLGGAYIGHQVGKSYEHHHRY